jgi:flagellin-specific chaperone FliS
MGRLTEANLHRDPDRIADVARILEPVRDAFKQAVMEQGKGK